MKTDLSRTLRESASLREVLSQIRTPEFLVFGGSEDDDDLLLSEELDDRPDESHSSGDNLDDLL